MQRILSLAAALALLAPSLAAQTIRGRVIDAGTGAGVPQATVAAVTVGGRGAGQARADADGKFSIAIRAPGEMRLRVARAGYRETLTDLMPVAVRETLYVEVNVSTAPMTLAPLRVTSRVSPPHRRSLELNGFYDREREGFGRRLYREDIERQSNLNLAQVLSRVTGVVKVQNGPFEYIVFNRSSTVGMLQPGSTSRSCLPLVFLDGTRMAYGGRMDINAIVSPDQIEAVELYSSAANVPVQYNGSGSACGVVLIWTRAER